ncbi:MAG TPA: cupin domain-containing protein [Deltaproteobacteria bacterium]|nr:cupin domain-containing protein [Deltaproteobacteria bacterium]
MKQEYGRIRPYVTKDGSVIRELIHPDQGVETALSLAEATIFPGKATLLHLHRLSTEVYHVVRGKGRMLLGGETLDLTPGDTVLIRPGTPHRVHNTGEEALVILCCCSPAYAHEDTALLDQQGGEA